jgi:hypothetical protein
MPGNYVLLERIELAASAASVTFSNIPQSGYSDLKIDFSVRNTADINTVNLTINGVTTNQTARRVMGTGSSAISSTYTEVQDNPSGSTANTFGSGSLYIPNYTSSSNKSMSFDIVSENNATLAYTTMEAWLWSSTAAITSIGFEGRGGGTIAADSTFSLYGLAAVGTTPAIAPKASGGNRIDYDGTYWYHTFLSSGTFTPQVGLNCDYLVVAGGGAGGGSYAGGGGAGGLRSTVTATGGGGSLESPLSVVSGTAYTVTIGAGGVGASGNSSTSGSNSVFASITSTGGGRGANGSNGVAGGSGGGAGGRVYTGGSGTSGQGYAGGNANYVDSSVTPQGGGGGAGAVGGNAVYISSGVGQSGAGGAGVAIASIASATTTGVSNYYAGGGGGSARLGGETTPNGAGGAGGGGAGATTDAGVATAGTANTGGGGGGAGVTGANGGSGIVIIRYPIA